MHFQVAGGGGADSILRFRLERGGDGMKRCQKMKQRERARLSSMGRKRDTARRRGDVDQMIGDTREGKRGDDTT
jgi:hypothetical protein